MAKNTLRSVSSYLRSQEKIKWLMNTESICTTAAVLQINDKFFHSVIRLPDSHKVESIWINWAGYSFQREWEQWNKWRRTFPRERLPVIRSRGTWLRSSPPRLGSAGETQAGFWVQFRERQKKKKKESMMELTFTWKTVRMAAGNVSKLVVGVSSSKLNLQGGDK